ncbi:hypothetical protein PGT21_011378 [Puccinia graminis f. sp. tritici]|uniref:Uncharacterized protein n=1 Tax=Puccinia graminis f. sp. tritici TaxID=56615 RepID=A0A5B0N2A4_PUCGR|nr:hypothetical protein PGT21_011378 [Puccinia graminis f. sp. tritici]
MVVIHTQNRATIFPAQVSKPQVATKHDVLGSPHSRIADHFRLDLGPRRLSLKNACHFFSASIQVLTGTKGNLLYSFPFRLAKYYCQMELMSFTVPGSQKKNALLSVQKEAYPCQRPIPVVQRILA